MFYFLLYKQIKLVITDQAKKRKCICKRCNGMHSNMRICVCSFIHCNQTLSHFVPWSVLYSPPELLLFLFPTVVYHAHKLNIPK